MKNFSFVWNFPWKIHINMNNFFQVFEFECMKYIQYTMGMKMCWEGCESFWEQFIMSEIEVPVGDYKQSALALRALLSNRWNLSAYSPSSSCSISFHFCSILERSQQRWKFELKLIQPLWASCEHALLDDHQCQYHRMKNNNKNNKSNRSGQRTFCFAIKSQVFFSLIRCCQDFVTLSPSAMNFTFFFVFLPSHCEYISNKRR